MLKVIDLVYYSHNDIDKPQLVLNIHAPANGFAPYIKDKIDLQFVKHLNYEGTEKINGIKYSFFKSRNTFWHIPFKTHRYIRNQQPDIVIVEGLIFPLQLIILKLQLGKRTRVIAQHHGEKPFKGIKGMFQQLADKFISTYLFTSKGNASIWIDKKIIKNFYRCKEVLEASTYFKKLDKKICQDKLGMKLNNNFLWVGRLDKNKDPLIVLKAFEEYIVHQPSAKLYMIFQDEELLKEVKNKIASGTRLKEAAKLIGYIDHNELACWYSAADFYISGSHKEGSGYALLEAMACGCIPVVTNIPAFIKITSNGKVGFLYNAGNADKLRLTLQQLANIDITEKSKEVEKHFHEHLDFKNIADNLFGIFNETVSKVI